MFFHPFGETYAHTHKPNWIFDKSRGQSEQQQSVKPPAKPESEIFEHLCYYSWWVLPARLVSVTSSVGGLPARSVGYQLGWSKQNINTFSFPNLVLLIRSEIPINHLSDVYNPVNNGRLQLPTLTGATAGFLNSLNVVSPQTQAHNTRRAFSVHGTKAPTAKVKPRCPANKHSGRVHTAVRWGWTVRVFFLGIGDKSCVRG